MSMREDVSDLAARHAPSIVLSVRLHEREGEVARAEIASSSTIVADANGDVDLATCLAGMKYAYSVMVERFADRLGIPQNRLHALINDHMNQFTATDLSE